MAAYQNDAILQRFDDEPVLTFAISYKHHTTEHVKLSNGHRRELKAALPCLARELEAGRFQIYIDRILSASKRNDDRSWCRIGLAPYLELPVLFISGDDRSDEQLMAEMNTIWINIELVAVALGIKARYSGPVIAISSV